MGKESNDQNSEKIDKDTQEILDEVAEEEKGNEKPEDGKPDKPEEGKPDEGKPDKPKDGEGDGKPDKPNDGKPDEGKPDEGKPEDTPQRRDPKLMPTWVHEGQKKEWLKEKGELEAQIQKLTKSPDGGKPDGNKPEDGKPSNEKHISEDLEKQIKGIAEKHKLDPELVKSLITLGRQSGGNTLPKEITDKLANLDKLTEEREIATEEAAFSKDFDSHVLPLVKKEYGDNIEPDKVSAIKDLLKKKAYTEEFKSTPYTVIYKGLDDFRKFSQPPSQSAEQSRGGAERLKGDGGKSGDGASDNQFGKPWSELSEEEVEKLSGEEFDKYSDYMGSRKS